MNLTSQATIHTALFAALLMGGCAVAGADKVTNEIDVQPKH
ncbi:MAG: hypothetical protein WBV55_18725 [Candidatus Sulfotelmatobacter sp.]